MFGEMRGNQLIAVGCGLESHPDKSHLGTAVRVKGDQRGVGPLSDEVTRSLVECHAVVYRCAKRFIPAAPRSSDIPRPGPNDALLSYHFLMGAGGLDTMGSPAFTAEDSTRYRAAGWWSDLTLSDAVRRNAEQLPDRAAYSTIPARR